MLKLDLLTECERVYTVKQSRASGQPISECMISTANNKPVTKPGKQFKCRTSQTHSFMGPHDSSMTDFNKDLDSLILGHRSSHPPSPSSFFMAGPNDLLYWISLGGPWTPCGGRDQHISIENVALAFMVVPSLPEQTNVSRIACGYVDHLHRGVVRNRRSPSILELPACERFTCTEFRGTVGGVTGLR